MCTTKNKTNKETHETKKGQCDSSNNIIRKRSNINHMITEKKHNYTIQTMNYEERIAFIHCDLLQCQLIDKKLSNLYLKIEIYPHFINAESIPLSLLCDFIFVLCAYPLIICRNESISFAVC